MVGRQIIFFSFFFIYLIQKKGTQNKNKRCNNAFLLWFYDRKFDTILIPLPKGKSDNDEDDDTRQIT